MDEDSNQLNYFSQVFLIQALPTAGIQKLDDRKLHKDEKHREMFRKCGEDSIRRVTNYRIKTNKATVIVKQFRKLKHPFKRVFENVFFECLFVSFFIKQIVLNNTANLAFYISDSFFNRTFCFL